MDFNEFFKFESLENYIFNNDKNKIINDLIEWELFKFGIDEREIHIELSNIRILKNKKNIVLSINDGFMCNLTLKNLFEFKPQGDEQTDGYRLAKAFVDAGIKVPQEVFVGIYQKLYKYF